MNARRAVIHLECYGKEEYINSLEEVWRTQSVDQWLEWLTRPAPEDEVPNIDWVVTVFTKTKGTIVIQTPVLSHGHSQWAH